MKNWIPAAVACLLAGCSSGPKQPEGAPAVAAATTDARPAPAVAAPDSATAAKNWQTFMTPGKEHQMMAESAGTWVAETSMWQAPGARPDTSTMTQENKMLMGGRYLESAVKGKFNGMPFEGLSTTAYDNLRKVYISTWIDNMGTGIMQMEGTWDEATKTINFKGNVTEPASGGVVPMRETLTMIDKDHQLMSMFAVGPDGKEYKSMQIHYTRKR